MSNGFENVPRYQKDEFRYPNETTFGQKKEQEFVYNKTVPTITQPATPVEKIELKRSYLLSILGLLRILIIVYSYKHFL